MNGRLSDHPLAELVREISDTRLSGALRLERERAKAAVYFEAGEVAAAVANVRALRLVEVLRRSGAVDAGRLYMAVGERMSDEQAGVELVRSGLLDEAGLKRLQERQSKEVLGEVLRWDGGEWSFDPRVRLAAAQVLHLDVSGLLAESARNLPPGLVAARMRDDEAQTITPAEGLEEKLSSGFRLLPAEAFVMSRIYAPARLREIIAVSGLPEDETRRAVYILALGGLLTRMGGPRILPAGALKLATQQQAAAAAPPASGRTTAERERPSQSDERPAAEPEPDRQGAIEELYALARGATHYEVLGVARSASADEVKRVYYAHARRLHPDRFRRDADEETRQRIDAAFARVAQAYDTLRDSALRAAYDIKIAKQKQSADGSRQ